MFRQILVPLDGSRFAESALPVALSLSRRTGAPVHVVTVVEPLPSFTYDGWAEAAGEWADGYVAEVAERIGSHAGGAVTSRVRSGSVARELEEEAEEASADLVVMATHGRGALTRVWLGSVADELTRHTDRPVLLVRPDGEERPEPDADPTFRKVLVPLDGSDLSESALAHAIEVGGLFDAAYHLVRVVPFPVELATPYLPHTIQMNRELMEEAKEAARAYLEGHVERMRARSLEVDSVVLADAQPGHAIVREVEESGCDFVAMATHGRGGLARAILGSTADKVVRAAHVPVLLYRPGS